MGSKEEKRVRMSTTHDELSRSASNSSIGGSASPERESAKKATSARRIRTRTISGSKSEDHFMTSHSGRRVFTKGRPPWYDATGRKLSPYVIGICGGSASGKTTVAQRIIALLEMPWVTVLSMDSFYKVLSPEDHEKASRHEYNFDHPSAFDFDLMEETLTRLRHGLKCDVPVYDFTTHRRDKQWKTMYGADVVIFEGILAFFTPEIVNLMDLRIFVDTDSDTRLARRLDRDTRERGRDVAGILEQYFNHVKPAFDNFIAPAMKHAHIIIPRGGENHVAIDLIVKRIKSVLSGRGYEDPKTVGAHTRAQLLENMHNGVSTMNGVSGTCSETSSTSGEASFPETLSIVRQTPQVLGLHTFIRNRNCSRDQFIFYSNRLIRILIEHALSLLPFEDAVVSTPDGKQYQGKINSFNEVVKDCKVGKILIQTDYELDRPELHYVRLPQNVHEYKVLLMDATLASGAAAMMAIRTLLDHDVAEENIMLVSLLTSEVGVHSVAYAFPRVLHATTAVDPRLHPQHHYVIPGIGNFGDRFYGTELKSGGAVVEHTESSDDEENDAEE